MYIAIADGFSGKEFFQSEFATAEEEQEKGQHKGWKILVVEHVAISFRQEKVYKALLELDMVYGKTYFRDHLVRAFECGYRDVFMGPISGLQKLDEVCGLPHFLNLFLHFEGAGLSARIKRVGS